MPIIDKVNIARRDGERQSPSARVPGPGDKPKKAPLTDLERNQRAVLIGGVVFASVFFLAALSQLVANL